MTSKLSTQSSASHQEKTGSRRSSRLGSSTVSIPAKSNTAKPTLKDGLTPIVDELVRRGITLAQARREFERQLIEASIRSSRGNMGRAAQSLGVHRNTLRNKVTDLGIKPRQLVENGSRRTDER